MATQPDNIYRCPERAEIEGCLSGPEPVPAARAFHDHARTCPRCREEARRAAEQVLGENLARYGGHADAIALSRYLDGEIPEGVRLLMEAHLAVCAECRKRLEAMRRGRAHAAVEPGRVFAPSPVEAPSAQRERRPRALLFPALAGTAATVAVVALLWAGAGRLKDTGSPAPKPPIVAVNPPKTNTPEAPKAGPILERPEPGSTRGVGNAASPSLAIPSARQAPAPTAPNPGPVRKPAPQSVPQPMVKPGPEPPESPTLLASLPEDASRVPPWARADLRRLESTPPTFRGATIPPPGPVALLVPDPGNRGLEAVRPGFAWKVVGGATSYRVRLTTDPVDIDEEPRVVDEAEVVVPRYALRTDLPLGNRVRVEVQPMSAGMESGSPGVFGFRMLSDEERRQASWARDNVGETPVVSALVMYRLGRFAEAERIARDWPAGERTDRWKAALARALERRRQDPSR